MKYIYSQLARFSAGLQNSFLSGLLHEHCLIFSTFVWGFRKTLTFFIGDKKLRDSCRHFDFFFFGGPCVYKITSNQDIFTGGGNDVNIFDYKMK